eukprot:Em0020g143a
MDFVRRQLSNLYHWGWRFVGLEQTREEELVWAKIQDRMMLPESADKVDADCTSLALSRSATPSSVSPSIKSTGRYNATHTNKIKPDILPLIASGITQGIVNLMASGKVPVPVANIFGRRQANCTEQRASSMGLVVLWISYIIVAPMGQISSQTGVQQGDPLGPMLFALVLQKLVTSIDADDDCLQLLLEAWYLDDGVLA